MAMNCARIFPSGPIIEECLNPPVIYRGQKGWFTTEPFSEPEPLIPEIRQSGGGPMWSMRRSCLVPRWVKAKRRHLKYWTGQPVYRRLEDPPHARSDKKSKIQGQGHGSVAAAMWWLPALTRTRLIWRPTGCTQDLCGNVGQGS